MRLDEYREVAEMQSRIDKVKNQRDELLAASEIVLKSFSYKPNKGPVWYESVRIAVAKVKEAS